MRGEKQKGNGEWGVGSGEWGRVALSYPHSPLPTPHSPLPVSFPLFTQIGRVIEGNRYVFSSPAGDHRLFSDYHSLDPTIAVFTNGVEAVSVKATRRRPGRGGQRAIEVRSARGSIKVQSGSARATIDR